MAASSSVVNTFPVGLWGELSSTSRVRSDDQRGQRVDVGGVVGRHERHRAQPRAGHGRDGSVGVVGGLEGEDLVARVAQRQHRGGDRLGGAGRDEHLGGRVDRQPPEPLLVLGDGPAQRLDPEAGRVLVLPGPDGRDGGLGHLDRAVLVREPLPEVDRAGGDGQCRHLREDRRAEPVEAGGEQRSGHATSCQPSNHDYPTRD